MGEALVASSGDNDGYTIQALSRAFAILELFSPDIPRLSATQISEKTGLNRVTGYRICRALEDLGYLTRGEKNLFRLGIRAVTLANAAATSMDVTQISMPMLTKLQSSTGRTVNLATRDGTDIVYLVRLRSVELLEIQLSIGSRIPVHASSLGKAIAAFLPEEELEEMLKHMDFPPQTSQTITNEQAFREELALVRKNGYALNLEELATNICGIAMPIFDASAYPVAAINIARTESLTAEQIVQHHETQLRGAANEISTQLDHRSPSFREGSDVDERG